MKKISEPILFFGSGPVAAKSLEAVCESFTVQAVITKATPEHHHHDAPVVNIAKEKSLNIYFVRDKNELNNILANDSILSNVRLGILVDFGIIISKIAIDHFALGIVNSHFSLLPQWRGADPITFSILSGQEETGVSLMIITEGMDEGPLLAQQTLKINPDIITPRLTNELIQLSNQMLSSFLPQYIAGSLVPFQQDLTEAPTYSRKLTKEDGQIRWERGAERLEREIRAFIEWPKSHAVINNIQVIVTEAHVINSTGAPGTVDLSNGQLTIHCGRDSLVIDRLKPPGKREMSGSDFARGYLNR